MCACRERLLLVELCGMGERFGLLFLLNFFLSGRSSDERLSEPDRIRYWNQHHQVRDFNTLGSLHSSQWPPQWQIESEGYENLMRFREQEIMSLTGADERWENWLVRSFECFIHLLQGCNLCNQDLSQNLHQKDLKLFKPHRILQQCSMMQSHRL